MIRRLAWALILMASFSAAETGWQGTWAATIAGGGAAFAGTWSGSPGKTADNVAGSWSLRDANGAELATGTWAAVKEGNVWKGSWQARRASDRFTGGQIYSGEWKARVDLPANAQFSALFEAALRNAMSGTWSMGKYAAGAWTIRAYGAQ